MHIDVWTATQLRLLKALRMRHIFSLIPYPNREQFHLDFPVVLDLDRPSLTHIWSDVYDVINSTACACRCIVKSNTPFAQRRDRWETIERPQKLTELSTVFQWALNDLQSLTWLLIDLSVNAMVTMVSIKFWTGSKQSLSLSLSLTYLWMEQWSECDGRDINLPSIFGLHTFCEFPPHWMV